MNKGWKVVNSGIFIAALIGIFVLIVLISGKAPWRWDWTQTGVNRLSEQTKETLKGLKETVRVYAFTDGSDTGRQVEQLLRAYQKETDKLDVRLVDPVKEPSLAEKYQVQEYNTVVFVKGEKEEVVSPWDLVVPGATQASYGFRGEEQFTQAIRNLTASRKPVIYLLQGHGEVSGSEAAALRSYLTGEGNQVKELNLIRETRVPKDADVLVIAGPTSDLTDQETKMINQYLDGGGKVLVALSPEKGMSKWKNLSSLLKGLGIRAAGDLVVDPERAYFGDPLTLGAPVCGSRHHFGADGEGHGDGASPGDQPDAGQGVGGEPGEAAGDVPGGLRRNVLGGEGRQGGKGRRGPGGSADSCLRGDGEGGRGEGGGRLSAPGGGDRKLGHVCGQCLLPAGKPRFHPERRRLAAGG